MSNIIIVNFAKKLFIIITNFIFWKINIRIFVKSNFILSKFPIGISMLIKAFLKELILIFNIMNIYSKWSNLRNKGIDIKIG